MFGGNPKASFISLLLILSLIPQSCYDPADFSPTQEQIRRAVDYLISHYNPELQLIYESEQRGEHFLVEEYPELSGKLYFNNTYWIYSDNLFAYLALEPFSPYHSQKIKQKYDQLVLKVGLSNLFEVVMGKNIPDTIKTAKNYYYGNFNNCYIFYERHDQDDYEDLENYGDLCLYKALDLFFAGCKKGAEKWLYKAYSKFDGKGVYDKATEVNGYYANYKLALLLYTSRVLGLRIPAYEEIERKLWSMQLSNGGICALADLEGNPTGAANCETTSLTLMVYNERLIAKLNPHNHGLDWCESPFEFLKWVGVTLLVIAFLPFIFKEFLKHYGRYDRIYVS